MENSTRLNARFCDLPLLCYLPKFDQFESEERQASCNIQEPMFYYGHLCRWLTSP